MKPLFVGIATVVGDVVSEAAALSSAVYDALHGMGLTTLVGLRIKAGVLSYFPMDP